jgi:hypothetical protein
MGNWWENSTTQLEELLIPNRLFRNAGRLAAGLIGQLARIGLDKRFAACL